VAVAGEHERFDDALTLRGLAVFGMLGDDGE
jgi:hypothetical protein